ncbi:MAG: type IX secretion system protein PorQ [Flavobacteriales bacterium]|nr:type IX secretion system protein PorQ [Flavobacteriales bacterium]
MKKKLLTISLVLITVVLQAQTGGQTVFNSLSIPSSARIASMGGALPTVRDGDLSLALFNPALLDTLSDQQATLSYVNYFSGINLGYASYAHHLDSLGVTVSGSIQYVDYGDFTERDATGQDIGSFSAGDYAFVVGAAVPVDSLFNIGVNVKGIYSSISTYNSWGMAIDAGATYNNPAKKFSASLVVQNLGYQFKGYRSELRDTLPVNLQIGLAKQLKHAPFRFSLVFDQLHKWDLTDGEGPVETIDPITGEVTTEGGFEFGDKLMRHVIFGTEVLLGDNFRVNIGYNYRRRQELKLEDRPGTAGLSWGVGARIKKFSISYGRAVYHLAGPSNHFTVSTRISDW